MFIFYDFETSSKELIGQILSYSFILVDRNLEIIEELNGKIKLNRIQLPEIDALLTNKIDVIEHQKTASPENVEAKRIYDFLREIVHKYGDVSLVGFNSNTFDLNFLRNLLIRYGINPYFEGKLMNLDVLHYAQHLALSHADQFRWFLRKKDDGTSYYSFKLEHLAKSMEILDAPQTHDARDDVLLTIKLVQALEKLHGLPLAQFKAIKLLDTLPKKPDFEYAKQRVLDYPDTDRPPEKFKYKYWLKILGFSKEYIVLDLDKYQAATSLDCLRYINANKHFFILEPLSDEEQARYLPLITNIKKDPFFAGLTKEDYFELIKKDWDIEYQIHELGFTRIDHLGLLTEKLFKTPDSYEITLKQLLQERKEAKDNLLIQLYNRNYLNYHPNIKIDYLHKYLKNRYTTGTMLRNPEDFTTIPAQLNRIAELLNTDTLDARDRQILISLQQYMLEFIKTNQLNKLLEPSSLA